MENKIRDKFGRYKKGHNQEHSELTKQKIRQSLIGHKVLEKTRQKISALQKGKTFEERMGKEKAGQLKKKLSKRWQKEKNPAWLGGKKLEYDYKRFNNKFKNLIRKRDNQICINCLTHREKLRKALDIHHIDYDEKNTIPQNCISLCRRCHGLTQFNREHWKSFFQNLLSQKYNYQYSDKKEIILNFGGKFK